LDSAYVPGVNVAAEINVFAEVRICDRFGVLPLDGSDISRVDMFATVHVAQEQSPLWAGYVSGAARKIDDAVEANLIILRVS
jgi:hypothetical protein